MGRIASLSIRTAAQKILREMCEARNFPHGLRRPRTDVGTARIARYRLDCIGCAASRYRLERAYCADCACRVACAVCSDCADRALTLGLRVPRGFQCSENRAICSLRILKRSMEKNHIGGQFHTCAPIFRILKALLQTITPLGAPVFSGIVCGY